VLWNEANTVAGLALTNMDVINARALQNSDVPAIFTANDSATTVKISGGLWQNNQGTVPSLISMAHFQTGTALSIRDTKFLSNQVLYNIIKASRWRRILLFDTYLLENIGG
jgi:hypothetical protein